MNKLYSSLYFILFLFISSCFQDADNFVTNTNPFDDDYTYKIVEFDKVVELGIQSDVCYEIISFKIVEETFHSINKVRGIPQTDIYINMDKGINLYPYNDQRVIPFSEIQLDNYYTFKTSAYTYECDDTVICVDFSIVYFVEDTSPPPNHDKIHHSNFQQVCFERKL